MDRHGAMRHAMTMCGFEPVSLFHRRKMAVLTTGYRLTLVLEGGLMEKNVFLPVKLGQLRGGSATTWTRLHDDCLLQGV